MDQLKLILSGLINGEFFNSKLSKKMFWLVLCSALLVVPLTIIPQIATLAPAVHSKDLALRFFISVLLLFGMANWRLMLKPAYTFADVGLIGMTAVQILSVLFSEHLMYSVSTSWQLILLPMTAYFIYRIIPDIQSTKTLFFTVILCGILCSFYGLFSFLGIDVLKTVYPFNFDDAEGSGRNYIHSFFGNPEYFAGFIAPICVIVLGFIISPKLLGKSGKIGYSAMLVFLLVVLALSGSRAAVLGFIAGTGIIFLSHLLRQPAQVKKYFILAALAITAVGSIGIIVFSTSNPLNPREMRLYQRFTEITDLRSVSVRERIFFYTLTAYGIPKNPFLGTGPGTYQLYYFPLAKDFVETDPHAGGVMMASALNNRLASHPHNDYLEYIFEIGFLGFTFLALIYAYGIARFLRRELVLLKEKVKTPSSVDSLRIITFGAAGCMLLNAFTSFSLHMPARGLLAWTLIGLYFGIDKYISEISLRQEQDI